MSNTNKSSILRPPLREPLQDLQVQCSVANSDEDTTSTITLAALAKRRVSFSGRNSVKEYVPCAEPICVMNTPAYEELFSHLSSDSSCIGNNSGQTDENMSQPLSANRPRLPLTSRPSLQQQVSRNSMQQYQKYRNGVPQQFATQAAKDTQDESFNNTSDMSMTEPILYASFAKDQAAVDVSLAVSNMSLAASNMTHATGNMSLTTVNGVADTSNGDMSLTRAFGVNNSTCMNLTNETNNGMSFTKTNNEQYTADDSMSEMSFTKALVDVNDDRFKSQNNSSHMSFTKAMVVNDENMQPCNVLSQTSSSHMSFTKAMVVNDENLQPGNVLSQNSYSQMSFTNAMVGNNENLQPGNVLSQTNSSHMSFTKAMVVNDENLQPGNVLNQNSCSQMSFTKAMVANENENMPSGNVLRQSNCSQMSFTKAMQVNDENMPVGNVLSQNSCSQMSFTKAMVRNDENIPSGNGLSQSSCSQMSFTKAMVGNDENMSSGNVLSQSSCSQMSFTKAMVGNENEIMPSGNVLSQSSCSQMSFTKAMVGNDPNLSTGNASMSFTKAFDAKSDKMTIDDSICGGNLRNATQLTLGAESEEEMRRLMLEVEMEETLDSEKLKSYRLSDVSFLVRENLVSGKGRKNAEKKLAKMRRSSIATAGSNSPIDLSVTGNRLGQQDIDEEVEEEDEEVEEEVEEVEEEEVGEVEEEEEGEDGEEVEEDGEEMVEEEGGEIEEGVGGINGEVEEVKQCEGVGEDLEQDLDLESGSVVEEDLRHLKERRSEEAGQKEVVVEEEVGRREEVGEEVEVRRGGRRLKRGARKSIGGRALEIALEESRRLKDEGAEKGDENDGEKREDESEDERCRVEGEEEDEELNKMETDAECNNADNLNMSIDRNDDIMTEMDVSMTSVQDKESSRKDETSLHLVMKEETVFSASKREESKKADETFRLNLSETEVCDNEQGAEEEEGVSKREEISADRTTSESTPPTLVSHARLSMVPASDQVLQGCPRSKRKSDSLDLSREEGDVIESPSKLARLEAVTSSREIVMSYKEEEEQLPTSTPRVSNSTRSRTPRQSCGSHLDQSMAFSEVDLSLWQGSELNSTSGSSSLNTSASTAAVPVCWQQVQVGPHHTRYTFYEGALVASVQGDKAELTVDQDFDDHYVVCARKANRLFGERVAACQSEAEAMDVIGEVNRFVYEHDNLHRDLWRLWRNAKLDIIDDGRLKYNAVCFETRKWFSVTMDPDIIWEAVSDDAIVFKSFIGDIKESYIKHLYRCSLLSPNRLRHFTDSLEKFVTTPKKNE